MEKNLRKTKKSKRRSFYLLLGILFVISVILIFLLLYKPADFRQLQPVESDDVSVYLTHVMMPDFYNGLGRQKPFKLVISEQGLNDIIAHAKWPKKNNGDIFMMPVVSIEPYGVVIKGIVILKGFEFLVTVVLDPVVDSDGLANLTVSAVRVGALNITLAAKLIAKAIFQQHTGKLDINAADLRSKVAASMLVNKPFEPVFELKKKKGRAEKITLEKEHAIIDFIPVRD